LFVSLSAFFRVRLFLYLRSFASVPDAQASAAASAGQTRAVQGDRDLRSQQNVISPARQQAPLSSVPEMDQLIGPAGSEIFSVRTERQATNFFLMLPKDIKRLSGFRVPNVNGMVRIGTSQQAPVGRESHGRHLIAVTVQKNNRLESLSVPKAGRRVPAA